MTGVQIDPFQSHQTVSEMALRLKMKRLDLEERLGMEMLHSSHREKMRWSPDWEVWICGSFSVPCEQTYRFSSSVLREGGRGPFLSF